MRVTYDATVDCGYIEFVNRGDRCVKHTIEVKIAEPGIFGQLNVDIGHDGRVVGIEVLGVQTVMPKGFMEANHAEPE